MRREALRHRDGGKQHDGGIAAGLERRKCELDGVEGAERVEAEVTLDVLIGDAGDGLEVDGADAIGEARGGGTCGVMAASSSARSVTSATA